MSVHEPISIHDTIEPPVERARRRLGVSWPTIILFAAVISYVNGFWVTSLQGAVGALQRSEPPFDRWLRDSTIMLPIYAAGMLVAVLLARRWFGRSPRAVVRGAERRGADHRGVHARGHRRGRQQRGLRLPPADRAHRVRARHEPHRQPGYRHCSSRHTGRRLGRRLCRERARRRNRPSGSTSEPSPAPAH